MAIRLSDGDNGVADGPSEAEAADASKRAHRGQGGGGWRAARRRLLRMRGDWVGEVEPRG